QRVTQSRHAGTTRTTGVCWSMTSLTRIAQALVPGARHGRSLAFRSNHPMAASARSVPIVRQTNPVVELSITVVGRDRPGIIADVTGVLAELGLNLTDSTMTLLRGQFAMTLVCAGTADVAAVEAGLRPVADGGALVVTVREVHPDALAEWT